VAFVIDALVLAAALLAAPLGAQPASAAPVPGVRAVQSRPATSSQIIGRSVQGRAIRAVRIGRGDVAVLVVGCIHGDERAGRAVVARLRAARPPAGVSLWLVDLANPDGCRAGTRQNASGVDLNRNFPYRWRRLPRGTYYSGTGPLSEPEARALHGFLGAVRPAISIWYHQHARLVDASGGDPRVERRYARLVGLPYKRFARPPGSITSWQNRTFPRDTAFVVELPAGALTAGAARRHARAVLTVARETAR
jgi:protein MpaA